MRLGTTPLLEMQLENSTAALRPESNEETLDPTYCSVYPNINILNILIHKSFIRIDVVCVQYKETEMNTIHLLPFVTLMACGLQPLNESISTPDTESPQIQLPEFERIQSNHFPNIPSGNTDSNIAMQCASAGTPDLMALRIDLDIDQTATENAVFLEWGPTHEWMWAGTVASVETTVDVHLTKNSIDFSFEHPDYPDTTLDLVASNSSVHPDFYIGSVDLTPEETTTVACWADDMQSTYTYRQDGRCLNEDGQEGLNSYTVSYLRETGNGQCTFYWAQAFDEMDYSYPSLSDWDLRGAQLNATSLHFANLVNARLEGAAFDMFDFGYAEITGSVDDHTTVSSACTIQGDSVYCIQ